MDHLVLTAANEAQARAYRAQLAARDMSRVGRWHVLPDPGGRRVGSGAATIAALRHVEKVEGKRGLRGVSVLILHSGGDSRRLPAYAAQGKVFVPFGAVGRQGEEHALFDLVLGDLLSFKQTARRGVSASGGMVVIAAGDVYLAAALAGLGIEDMLRERRVWDGEHVLGVGFAAKHSVASRHGVYVLEKDGRVRTFLQKPSGEEMRREGALDRRGRAIVDTGIVVLPERAAERLARVPERAGELWRDVLDQKVRPLDLYEHLLMGWTTSEREMYVKCVGAKSEREAKGLRRLHACLKTGGVRGHVMEQCPFVHLGSTREYLEWGTRTTNDCHFSRPPTLDGWNLIANWPKCIDPPARFRKGQGAVCVPIGEGDWALVLFGVEDDFKTSEEAGGTICGQLLTDVLKRAGGADVIWPRAAEEGGLGERTAWNAKLCPVGRSRDLHTLVEWIGGRGDAPSAWRRAKRLSLSEIVLRVNHERLMAHQAECRRRERVAKLGEFAARARHFATSDAVHDLVCLKRAGEQGAVREGVQSLMVAYQKEKSASEKARLAQMAARMCEVVGAPARDVPSIETWRSRVWQHVRESVAQKVKLPTREPRPGILPDQVVWTTAPVRIDLAGGWTDTPPICSDIGGEVVNAAITLNGQYPIQAMCRLRSEGGIRITSVDLGRSVVIRSAKQLCRFDDPTDWAALAKAALVLSGLSPRKGEDDLVRWLKRLGGGVDLTFFSAVPKGSGLGTSSILGAAILASLARTLGEDVSHGTLIERTSLLEQVMSTGGGWQDQAGGITPGVKYLQTQTGGRQVPSVRAMHDALSAPAMRERLLLYYTGHQRLAKNILQQVVTRYLERDPGTMRVVYDLRSLASVAVYSDGTRDGMDLSWLVDQYWQAKKAIDPGATTLAIEKMLDPIRHELSAHMLPGAGGGGFVFMIAKRAAAARRVRARLEARPPNALARFYEFAVDGEGLRTVVL